MKLKDIAVAHMNQKINTLKEQLEYLFQRRKHVLESLRHALHNLNPKPTKAETQTIIRSVRKSSKNPSEVTVGDRKWKIWRLPIPVEGAGEGDFAIPIKDSQFVQGFSLFPVIPVDHPQYEEIRELADDDAKAHIQYEKTLEQIEELKEKTEHLDILDDHDEEYERKP